MHYALQIKREVHETTYEIVEEAKKEAFHKIKHGFCIADHIRVVKIETVYRFENNIEVVEENSNV